MQKVGGDQTSCCPYRMILKLKAALTKLQCRSYQLLHLRAACHGIYYTSFAAQSSIDAWASFWKLQRDTILSMTQAVSHSFHGSLMSYPPASVPSADSGRQIPTSGGSIQTPVTLERQTKGYKQGMATWRQSWNPKRQEALIAARHPSNLVRY